jgi:hypothetical protein
LSISLHEDGADSDLTYFQGHYDSSGRNSRAWTQNTETHPSGLPSLPPHSLSSWGLVSPAPCPPSSHSPPSSQSLCLSCLSSELLTHRSWAGMERILSPGCPTSEVYVVLMWGLPTLPPPQLTAQNRQVACVWHTEITQRQCLGTKGGSLQHPSPRPSIPMAE